MSLHVPRGRITVYFGHAVIEKYQIHRIRDEKLDSLLPACGGQNFVPVLFKKQLPTFKHTQCVIHAEDRWFPSPWPYSYLEPECRYTFLEEVTLSEAA